MIRSCPSCGTKNRVPANHLADVGKCGKCKSALPPLDEPLDVDLKTFDEVVSTANVPVLVDFWAAWCGPCQTAAPHVKSVARDMKGKAVVLKVDTDREQELARRFQVRSIPLFVVMKNGKPVMEQAGAVDAGTMREWLSSS